MNCENIQELIPLYLIKECNTEELQLVENHMGSCIKCKAQLETSRKNIIFIDEELKITKSSAKITSTVLEKIQESKKTRLSPLFWPLRIAAVLIISIGLYILVFPKQDELSLPNGISIVKLGDTKVKQIDSKTIFLEYGILGVKISKKSPKDIIIKTDTVSVTIPDLNSVDVEFQVSSFEVDKKDLTVVQVISGLLDVASLSQRRKNVRADTRNPILVLHDEEPSKIDSSAFTATWMSALSYATSGKKDDKVEDFLKRLFWCGKISPVKPEDEPEWARNLPKEIRPNKTNLISIDEILKEFTTKETSANGYKKLLDLLNQLQAPLEKACEKLDKEEKKFLLTICSLIKKQRIISLAKDLLSPDKKTKQDTLSELLQSDEDTLKEIEKEEAELFKIMSKHLNEAKVEIKKLIKELGDDNPDKREKAHKKILDIGRGAMPFLKEAVNDKDPERSSRVRVLIDEIPDKFGVEQAILDKAMVNGKYSDLVLIFKAHEDKQCYGDFNDYGYWQGGSWRGVNNIPEGYWVWIYPCWFIFKTKNK